MILQIDAGNTRVKWRKLSAGEIATKSAKPLVQSALYQDFIKRLKELLSDVSQVQISSVADIKPILAELERHIEGENIFVAETQQSQAGLTNSYQDVSRMGIDRWLAMLAAFNQYPQGVIVVDAGTAMTIDVVDGVGQHIGGYILPGFHTAIESLISGTSKIKVDENLSDDIEQRLTLGTNTSECISHGVLHQMKALVGSVVAEYQELQLIISGGDQELLLPYFPRAKAWSDIVLDGLFVAVKADK